jgi:hypothetical protein
MRNGGVRLQIYRTNHLKIQILLKREKINVEINILWLEVRLENVRYIEKLPTITPNEKITDTKWVSQEFWSSDSCTLLESNLQF